MSFGRRFEPRLLQHHETVFEWNDRVVIKGAQKNIVRKKQSYWKAKIELIYVQCCSSIVLYSNTQHTDQHTKTQYTAPHLSAWR